MTFISVKACFLSFINVISYETNVVTDRLGLAVAHEKVTHLVVL